MPALLQHLNIFELRPLISNLSCKLSTVTGYDSRKQLLCLVSEENDIVLRYTNEGGHEVLKLVSWFRRTNRVIHDVCFDPTGTWLLVLCFDNTLHVVPALAVVDKPSMDAQPHQSFSSTQITSFIIPFVGPHECPDSKNCPNHNPHHKVDIRAMTIKEGQTEGSKDQAKRSQENKNVIDADILAENYSSLHLTGSVDLNTAVENYEPSTNEEYKSKLATKIPLEAPSIEACSHDMPASMLANADAPPTATEDDKTGNSQVMAASFMASSTCPYPLSVVWWQTIEGVQRAIIGYSDGSICFVGLSPNCPFVASTAIESGSVVKMLTCKDKTHESVMLLITSSLKQQFKLLLEQKVIKYTYPGDSSPPTSLRESDWQIVMPLNTDSNSSDPASDNGQREEIDPTNREEEASTSSAAVAPATSAAPSPPIGVVRPTMAPPYNRPANNQQNTPPPPYSVAITRNVECPPAIVMPTDRNNAGSTTTTASGSQGVRFQQQPLPETMDDLNGRAGILPAARARLASLKSLGSKKLNAIKMRLTDNRQKLEEYIPENAFGSFAIIDSPSLTPEPLGGHTVGSFFTLQSLRNTYLLSALHTRSNSLTVHAIDVHLRPLFLYKLPKNCHDILISSNLLYSIQYVDLKETPSTTAETEKEGRDVDQEKQEWIDTEAELDGKRGDGDEEVFSSSEPEVESHETSSDTSTATSAKSSPNDGGRTGIAGTSSNSINAVGVISSAITSMSGSDANDFNTSAQLGLFRFEHETVLSLYQMATYAPAKPADIIPKDEKVKAFELKDIRSPMDYVEFYSVAPNVEEEFSLQQMEIMQCEFPKINYDPSYVVTNKNVYYIQLRKEPFALFLEAALAGEWNQCREFCNTFDINYELCIEFAGDYLMRRNKITQALLTYNQAKIKPIRTALKLAMYGHTCALMHLCAMALRLTYILKARYLSSRIIATILQDATYRHAEDVRTILPPTAAEYSAEAGVINEGASCSDFIYVVDESASGAQMSPMSQFHLSNLLLIALAEKAVNDKQYVALWNFLVSNTKYHTNMTSIVLSQSGLYSSALLLAKVRGVCLDTFVALTSVLPQEFGWYTELNVCLYNLSEPLLTEAVVYMPDVSVDYFCFLQDKLPKIRPCVLQRLEEQLCPFSPAWRPIVSHTSSSHMEQQIESQTTTTATTATAMATSTGTATTTEDNSNVLLFEFCRNLIETYLAILIHLESQRTRRGHIKNAFSTFRITYEDNQFAIESSRFKPISAGCGYCSCVVDGIAYFWGSNGVGCSYSATKSSEPPEPPHAVKSLELLAKLNLEVHAVQCGRQHTLVLTNNGLYAFGNNNLCQLGIGRHMQAAMQPMLVKALDGKNITILKAGQYHNAAVADGQLYTWGWGVYGQLGHGRTDNVAKPKLLNFFRFKKVIQVSLGHAHSLVLCQSQNGPPSQTELYVFGSNHFGQLGLGSSPQSETTPSMISPHCPSYQVKSLVPLRLYVENSNIRLIHTKFFTNLAVDDNNRLYTWGSSPQALRLANQIKRRANAKQKMEEQQKREMSKRFEATLTEMTAVRKSESSESSAPVPTPSLMDIESENGSTKAEKDEANAASKTIFTEDACMSETLDTVMGCCEKSTIPVPEIVVAATIAADLDTLVDVGSVGKEIVEKVNVVSEQESERTSGGEVEKEEEKLAADVDGGEEESEQPQTSSSQSQTHRQQKPPPTAEPESCEHLAPLLVDTSEVAGTILQISSGLFHFALISSSCTLYTWGKNLEHQLGSQDKERRTVLKPSPVDCIERPMYVDCGADFTVVMTTDYVVKAFGGNSTGQCGRDLGPSIDKMKQRVVCLPTSKRLMRFESQCVEVPVEINLPRPRIRLDNDPVRYLKSIPKFQAHFLQEADINFDESPIERPSPMPQQYKSTTTGADSSENTVTGAQDSDDMISSLENFSNTNSNNNDASPQPLSLNAGDLSPDEQSYERLPAIDLGDGSVAATLQRPLQDVERGQEPMSSISEAAVMEAAEGGAASADADDDGSLQDIRHYIHYCLYVFHGLYNPDKVRDFAKDRPEYRIRTLMLNFKFVNAFVLALEDCDTANKTLKIFEYFTKDTGNVPTRRTDLKYLIYHLLLHFHNRKFDLNECEQFFLDDLDYYLLELAYVLYFNNNNTVLEQNLNQKFKSLIAQEHEQDTNQTDEDERQAYKMEDTDIVFDGLSVKFKTIVCQRLVKYYSN